MILAHGTGPTVPRTFTFPDADATILTNLSAIAESQITNLVADLAGKAPLASPALTGTPTAPTAAAGTNTTQLATTAFARGLAFPTTVTLTDGATPALDASLGKVFRLAAAGDRTIAVPSNPIGGQQIVIQHYASGGARTLALNTGAGGFRFGTDITALTQTASGKTDYIGAIYNDTDSKWDIVAVTKGF